MKPKEYYIFVDDTTGEKYVVIYTGTTKFMGMNKAISIANKHFRTKTSDLIVGWGRMTNHMSKLTFWREYTLYEVPYKDLIFLPRTFKMEPNCLVVARRKK